MHAVAFECVVNTVTGRAGASFVRTNCRLRSPLRTQNLTSRGSASVDGLRNRRERPLARHRPSSPSWPCPPSSTCGAIRGASCIRSCTTTSRRSGWRPAMCATARGLLLFVQEEFQGVSAAWVAGRGIRPVPVRRLRHRAVGRPLVHGIPRSKKDMLVFDWCRTAVRCGTRRRTLCLESKHR